MKLETLALVATVLSAAAIVDFNGSNTDSWETYKAQHGKTYTSEQEHDYRRAVYLENLKEIEEHNASGKYSYTKGTNHLTDLTQEEFKAIHLTLKTEGRERPINRDGLRLPHVQDVNWVERGAVNHVKNQGQCGSCYTFSAVAVTESAMWRATGTVGDFSESQLVDCSESYGNNGCGGGLMDNCFTYYVEHGICTEESYPYVAKSQDCKADSCTKENFNIKGHQDVSGEAELQEACDVQPVAIGVDANNWAHYNGGIFDDCGEDLYHGVVLVGYTETYWLVRNSWGPYWGEAGYIRLARPGNTCGLADMASYPLV